MRQPVRKKRKQLTGPAREKAKDTAKRLYEQGATVRAVGAELGLSYGGAYRLLKDSGVTFRGRGGMPGKKARHG